LLPADIALVPERVYRRLESLDGKIIVPVHAKQKGHPILISSSLVPDILNEPSHSSLREILVRNGFETAEVEEETILLDVDTLEDYQKALGIASLQLREQH
jgi:molybdenum cofactor cytidylyltransferase